MADTLSPPSFIERDPAIILQESIAYYQELTGNVLQPAQVERLMISHIAYREFLLREGIQNAGLQGLVDFATDSNLDYLGRLVGVERLGAQFAKCIIQFNLVPGHAAVVIPAETRIQSVDGTVTFATLEDLPVGVGVLVATTEADAQTAGVIGNGVAIGDVKVIIDAQPYISSVGNIDVTAGGADVESDENLRIRIKLAPGTFSNAGSEDAYIFFAKSASQDIVDVAVPPSLGGGIVKIYPLMKNLLPTPVGILNAVFAACNPDKVRPLTDTVQVFSPTFTNYAIVVNITKYDSATAQDVQDLATLALNSFVAEKQVQLGNDIILTQIKSRATIKDKTYDLVLASPSADIILAANEIAVCTSVTVNIVGSNPG